MIEKVSMYTLSTCPWCWKTKKWFTEHQIPFDYIDYDLANEATQDKIMGEMDAAGADGFPFVRIGDLVVVGWQPAVYAKLMGIPAGV